MNIVKLVLVAAICYGGYHHWQKTQREGGGAEGGALASADQGSKSRNGFVTLPPFEGAAGGKQVVIFSPPNCPEEGAQRANALADGLSRKGIQVVRSHSANWNFEGGDQTTANKVMAVMNGDVPIVFVKGRAKANPSLDEVLAEYGSTKI
ncbi:MAG: hypothetical protein V4857_16270 [Pseudomonadota bacterium]